jgi:hypothetical protein
MTDLDSAAPAAPAVPVPKINPALILLTRIQVGFWMAHVLFLATYSAIAMHRFQVMQREMQQNMMRHPGMQPDINFNDIILPSLASPLTGLLLAASVLVLTNNRHRNMVAKLAIALLAVLYAGATFGGFFDRADGEYPGQILLAGLVFSLLGLVLLPFPINARQPLPPKPPAAEAAAS